MSKHVVKNHFEHDKKSFKPGQELSSEELKAFGKSADQLIKAGAIQKSEEPEAKKEEPKESPKKESKKKE